MKKAFKEEGEQLSQIQEAEEEKQEDKPIHNMMQELDQAE